MNDDNEKVIGILHRNAHGQLEEAEEYEVDDADEVLILSSSKGLILIVGELTESDWAVAEQLVQKIVARVD